MTLFEELTLEALLQFVLLAASACALVAYLCRLDMLTYRGHMPGIVLMHACFAAAVAFAGGNAWNGHAGALEVFVVVGSLLWLRVSWPSWRGGQVPDHYSRPVPLDEPAASRPPA